MGMDAEDIEYTAGKDYIRTVFTFLRQFVSSWTSASCLIFFLSIGIPAYGGIWPQANGSFLKLAEWWIASDRHFDSQGKIVPNTHEFGYYATCIYAGYDIANRLTTTVYFPFLNYLYAVPPSGSGKINAWALGDAEIGLKYVLLSSKKTVFNLRVLVGVPLGKGRGSLPAGLQTGDGGWSTAIIGETGIRYQLLKSEGWLKIYGGYNKRADGLTNEILYGAEAGIKTSKEKFSFVTGLSIVDAVDEGYYPVNAQSLFSNKREYVSITPEILYHPSKTWAVSARAGFKISGRNIFAEPMYSLGIVHKWNEL